MEALPGTREERLGRTVTNGVADVPVGRFSRAVSWLRGRLARLDHDLHHGQITWWIRAASWLLLAVPAWVVSPWLVLPAVVLVEVAWIVGLRWSWHRDRPDHVVRS